MIENLIIILPNHATCSYYRTFSGAGIDLVIESPDGARWAVEVKNTICAQPEKGFYFSLKKSSLSALLWCIQEATAILRPDANVLCIGNRLKSRCPAILRPALSLAAAHLLESNYIVPTDPAD